MTQKVTVTGGAGFIGSHLVDLLLQEGYAVTVIDDLSSGKSKNLPKDKVDLRVYDIADDPKKIATIIKGSECVFHLAALTSVQGSLEDPKPYNQVNITGTVNMLEACRIAEVKKFVFSSSSSVYGNTLITPTSEQVEPDPISPYALSKQIGEQYCKLYSHNYGIVTTCLRYFNVFGERTNPKSSYRSVIPIFLENSKLGKKLPIVNDGNQTRDFIHVKDVARANFLAMSSKFLHSVINIGSGKSLSVNQIASMLGGETESIGFRLEPKASLANIDRADSILSWKPEVDFETWINGQNK